MDNDNKVIMWNKLNTSIIFERLVSHAAVAGLKAGKINKTKGLTLEHITKLLDINIQKTLTREHEIQNSFYLFDKTLSDFRKFVKTGYGFSPMFIEHLKETFDLDTDKVDTKLIENFLLTGRALSTYISFSVLTNAVRRDDYARANMLIDIRFARDILSLMNISLETAETYLQKHFESEFVSAERIVLD